MFITSEFQFGLETYLFSEHSWSLLPKQMGLVGTFLCYLMFGNMILVVTFINKAARIWDARMGTLLNVGS